MRVPVTYVGPFDEIEFDELDLIRSCKNGDTVWVPAELAGRPSVSVVDVAGLVVVIDPGEGLLAQEGNWRSPEPELEPVLVPEPVRVPVLAPIHVVGDDDGDNEIPEETL